MNSCTTAAVKGWSIGIVTAMVDGESQSSKELTDHITSRFPTPGFKSRLGKGNVAVMGPLDISINRHTHQAI